VKYSLEILLNLWGYFHIRGKGYGTGYEHWSAEFKGHGFMSMYNGGRALNLDKYFFLWVNND